MGCKIIIEDTNKLMDQAVVYIVSQNSFFKQKVLTELEQMLYMKIMQLLFGESKDLFRVKKYSQNGMGISQMRLKWLKRFRSVKVSDKKIAIQFITLYAESQEISLITSITSNDFQMGIGSFPNKRILRNNLCFPACE